MSNGAFDGKKKKPSERSRPPTGPPPTTDLTVTNWEHWEYLNDLLQISTYYDAPLHLKAFWTCSAPTSSGRQTHHAVGVDLDLVVLRSVSDSETCGRPSFLA